MDDASASLFFLCNVRYVYSDEGLGSWRLMNMRA